MNSHGRGPESRPPQGFTIVDEKAVPDNPELEKRLALALYHLFPQFMRPTLDRAIAGEKEPPLWKRAIGMLGIRI